MSKLKSNLIEIIGKKTLLLIFMWRQKPTALLEFSGYRDLPIQQEVLPNGSRSYAGCARSRDSSQYGSRGVFCVLLPLVGLGQHRVVQGPAHLQIHVSIHVSFCPCAVEVEAQANCATRRAAMAKDDSIFKAGQGRPICCAMVWWA